MRESKYLRPARNHRPDARSISLPSEIQGWAVAVTTFKHRLKEGPAIEVLVAWDEDLDDRILDLLDLLYLAGTLGSLLCVGERKGCFFASLRPGADAEAARQDMTVLLRAQEDHWNLEICS